MPLPEPWPLEAVFGVVALWSGLISLFLLAVERMTGVSRVYPLAGFFYILARAGVVALVSLVLWKQLTLWQANGDWRDVGRHLFAVLILAFVVLEGVVILAMRVVTNRYGARGATAA